MAINLAKELAKQFAKHGKPIGVKSATLTLYTTGSRSAGAVSAGTNPTSTSYSCKAFIEQANASYKTESTTVQYDRLISIFGGSLPAGIVPTSGAKITMVDVDGTSKTFRVLGGIGAGGGAVGVESDGVGAVFSCACVKA